ncbi:MAG: LuxR C-terminal-related transcriptional regulator [Atopobiaceae bacterium]|jgi:LuxR family maltose regulon positive regulatory protein|nr:LuxR C-terminal-related transcriptional regulator [Atopobiaceae bacterium]
MSPLPTSTYLTDDLCELFGDAVEGCRIIMFSAPTGCGKSVQSRGLLRLYGIPFVECHGSEADLAEHIESGIGRDGHAVSDRGETTLPPGDRGVRRGTCRRDAVLVDDLQLLASPSDQRVLAELIATHPETLFVLCGRCPLPAWLSSFEAARQTLTIEPEDLVLDEASLRRLFDGRHAKHTDDLLHEIIGYTKGYPLLTSILMEGLRKQHARGNDLVLSDELKERSMLRLYSFYDEMVYRAFTADERHLLLCLAPFDHLDDGFAVALTGDSRAPQMIARLRVETRMFRTNSLSTLSFWSVFQSYLLWRMRKDWSSDEREEVYSNAAGYFEASGDIVDAVKCYDLYENREKVIELLSRHSRKNPRMGSYRELAPYYFSLTDQEARVSPDLMSGLSMAEMLFGNYERSDHWYDVLSECVSSADTTPQDRKQAQSDLYYLDMALLQRTSGQETGLIISMVKAIASGLLDRESFSFSVTSGLPSILNGGRDFSAWVGRDRLLYKTMAKPIVSLLGKDGAGLPLCAITESLFEKGEEVSPYIVSLASSVPDVRLRGTPDIEYAIVGLLARIHIARNRPQEARSLVADLQRQFLADGDSAFLPNIEASIVRIALYQGDGATWKRWLATRAPKVTLSPYGMDRYLYQTLALAYLAEGKNEAVLLAMAPWRTVFERCNRTIDLIGLHALTAIALYRAACPSEARGASDAHMHAPSPDQVPHQGSPYAPGPVPSSWSMELAKALEGAHEFGYVRPISQYGIAILPLLERCGYGGDPEWFDDVMSDTRLRATYYPRYLQPRHKLLEPLTSTEQKVLRLLAGDMSNARIGEVLDIKLPTVKTHVSHIMQKLDVSSRAQAKTAAREMDLL